jgi:peptidoglycan/xylan/chitin deacetylase (PgdA/CDA1 family)
LDAGRLYLDLHGWEHIDYGQLSPEQLDEHLEKSFEFMLATFKCLPIRWATPWGASGENIQAACKKWGLIWEGVADPVVDQGHADKLVREKGTLEPLKGKVVMVHWFERGLKLFRIVQIGKHGTLEEAKKANPKAFG